MRIQGRFSLCFIIRQMNMCLMTQDELMFSDEIDCRDLFDGMIAERRF
ncbi:MAG: hypothetical protein ACLRZ6_07325 [Lachnospiraceae bacterium]